MSDESDLALEETEEGSTLKERTCVSGVGFRVVYKVSRCPCTIIYIQWRICRRARGRAIKGQEESCAAKGKHACCSKGEVFLIKMTWQSCEGLELKL